MKIKKFGSFMTAITLLVVGAGNKSIEASDFNISEKSKLAATLTADTPKLLTEEEIPNAIDYDEALKKGHCERVLEEEENLNSIVFKNNDGTQSCYFFNYPVKYVDDFGKIKDKSMDIKKDNKSDDFTSASSDIKTTFNKELSDGVELTYKDINIQMIPNFITKNTTTADLSEDQQSVSYDCNSNVSLEYSLTYQGFKEDIILDKYTGVTEFSFQLLTNGLKLSNDDAGNLNLYDGNNTSVASIGEIIIFDSDNNNSIGMLSYTAIKENHEYTLTITVDENYLTNPNTVYPVYIDPTIEIDYEHYGTNLYGNHNEQAITYATYDSNSKLIFNKSMTIGKYGSQITRVLMRFPVLFSNYPEANKYSYGFEHMDTNLIKSAKVYLRDVGYQPDINALNISCYRFQTHWPESISTLNWSTNSSKYNPNVLTTHNICHSNGLKQDPLHTYAFDITSAVKNWGTSQMNTNYWKFGIMFKADDSVENGNTSKYCSFGSYNSVYYAPYLVIDYDVPYDYEAVEDAPISYTYRRICNLEAGKTYIFQTEKATDYADSDTELYLFKSTMTPQDNTWFNDDSSSRYSRIEATIQESGSYILMAKCFDAIGKSGECTKGYCNIYQIDPETQEKTLLKENAQLGGYRLAITNYIYNKKTYNSFTVNSNNFDTIMYILSENSVSDRKVIGYNDDYRDDSDFNWGLASRVQQSYSTNNTPKYVFVSSYNPTISDTVDIYGMCKETYSNQNMFPNLKSDDAMISAPGSYSYNCISYSGGITHEWINPDLTFSGGTLSPWYNENNEIALDNYYGNIPPRYVGATTYEVTDNANESVVNVYKKGTKWTHASVRKPANNQMHGYAWESKLGHQERIFHPRNSLDNESYENAYGHIEKMYKIAETNSTTSISTYNLRSIQNEDISFEESVEARLTEVQNIELTDSEKKSLKIKIDNINDNAIDKFNILYDKWTEKILNDNFLFASNNVSDFIHTSEYKELSNLIDKNNNLSYLIINQYLNNDSDVFINTLFNDKVVSKNSNTVELANTIRKQNNKISTESFESSTYIAPTYNTNALCFIKEFLNDESYSSLK